MPNRQTLLAFASASIFTALNVTLTNAAPFMVVNGDKVTYNKLDLPTSQ